MAEIVVGAAVTVLIEKLLSADLIKLARSQGIDSQLKKLKKNLDLIEAVLADAGQKHIRQRAVRLWLQDLQDLAYDIDDVLDDIATETMARKLNEKPHGSTSIRYKVLKKIIPRSKMYGRKMSSKLYEITVRLDDLVEQRNNLGLDVNVIVELRSNRYNRRLEQTSLVDESTVLGREADQEALLSKLLGEEACNQNVSIMSIVGPGGIGKTTLAQLLYNNEKVKDHFVLRAWVCVPDEFDLLAVSTAIYHNVTGEYKAFSNLDLCHVALKEKLSNKRFLLVLDDVWNEDHEMWKILEIPLKGAPGSKIIVTTRNTKVASVMNSVEPHNLGILSDKHALSLLAKSALDEHNFDKHPSLTSVARSIIEKCDGLPLALIAIGRVLYTKGSDKDEWKQLLNSEIWSDDESGILPVLKLSYYDLPSQLKQVFAYCCFFPKDYLFNKNELVLLWMAEGFLNQPKGNMSMESLGCQYFEELQSRSFFQHSMDDESRYTMHDLMNDLAISVAGESFFMLDDKMDLNGRNDAFEKFRHFSLTGQRGAEYGKLKELHRSRRLRTFLPMSVGWMNRLDHDPVQLIAQLNLLRVLSLTQYSITEVPKSVGGLKHLRYLNISYTSIEQVPEQVSELYNLQSLLVHHCCMLSRLPVSFAKLINLRHLDMSHTPKLEKTPLGIGGLTSLRTLTKVFIERGNEFKISDLKGLLDLQGQLSIKGLEKVTDPQQAKDANLEEKKGLVSLDMEWSDVFDDSRNSMIEYEVIQRLRPHTKLNKLKIWGFGGMKFPSWLEDPSFDKLTELRLKGCRNSRDFHSSSFPSLEYLEITDMEVLEIWSNCDGDNDKTTRSFPHLREIYIENCPKLAKVSLGLIPSLEVLVIKRCSEALLRAMVGVSSAIQSLEMFDIEGLTKLDGEVLKHLRAVEDLSITCCNELRYLRDTESDACRFLVKLRKLYVYGCKKLVSMEDKEVNVGSSNMKSVIREVTLWDCDSLESYNCPNSVEELDIRGCSSMTSLTLSTTLQELPSSLKSLRVHTCSSLNSFPHERLQSLTSLEEMTICNCESMDESFPCGLWPPNLRELRIGELKKPMSEWGLQNYPTSLVELVLYGDNNSGVVSFAMEEDASNNDSTSFLLPPSLTTLWILDFKDVESISEVVLQHLTHLQKLHIWMCPNLRDVPQSTSSLVVTDFNSFLHERLQSLTSPEEMIINYESMDESFPSKTPSFPSRPLYSPSRQSLTPLEEMIFNFESMGESFPSKTPSFPSRLLYSPSRQSLTSLEEMIINCESMDESSPSRTPHSPSRI